jgi:hypothetical protein
MGAGAFIMSEITGIPYSEIVTAAIIPALLYFASIYFNVDLNALKYGMKGLPRSELPRFDRLARQAFLFLPIFILIGALFAGYSVIRAGTYGMAAAAVVSWLTPYRMGPRQILYAFEIAAKMTLQLVAVCAAAGVIVGVIALTGIGTRFSSMLLGMADQNQAIALFFAMIVSIILGMGMPTTAAYAVAASVIGPGLVQMGIPPLTAHFFIFYYAVMSAITPPVALAAYAGAAIAQSDPMKTSVESFRIGLAAFVVPFMFFSSPALLMEGSWGEIIHVVVSASLGIFMLSASVQGWFFGLLAWPLRIVLLVAALSGGGGGGACGPAPPPTATRRLLSRQFHAAQIWQVRVEAAEFRARGLVIHRGRNDDILSDGPVGRRRNAMFRGGLKRVERAQHLGEVAAHGHRVGHAQLELLVRSDDEDRAHRRAVGRRAPVGQIGLGGQHVESFGNGQPVIGDDREFRGRAADLLDIALPFAVILDTIDRDADHLGAAFLPFSGQPRDGTEFGGADRCEIPGV